MSGIAPEFEWVSYVDPWADSPPVPETGVLVEVIEVTSPSERAKLPANPVLAARLLQGGVVLASIGGSSETYASILPPAPLAGGLPVLVQVEWTERGSAPAWKEPEAIASAPVLVAIPRLLSASIAAGKAVVSWDNLSSAGGASGGNVEIFADGELVAQIVAPGVWGEGLFPQEQGVLYTLYIRGARPIVANQLGGFDPPYTSGPYSAGLPVPTGSPVIATASYDGETVNVAWSPVVASELPAPEIQYTLYLLADQQIVASFPAGPNGASAAVGSLADAGASAVAASVSFGPLAGPPSAHKTLLTPTPVLTGAAFDAATPSTLTISWQALPGASRYDVELTPAVGAPILESAPGSPFTPTAALPETGSFAVRVRGVTSDGSLGPWSAPITIPGLAPAGLRVHYDSRLARIEWDPLPGAPAGSYVATVLSQADALASQRTTATQTVLKVPFDEDQEPTAVVQAIAGDAIGPPSAPVALFQPGLYPASATEAPGVTPHVRPARAPMMPEEDIVVQLPELFTTHQPELSVVTPAFKVVAPLTPLDSPFTYTLTILGNGPAWKFAIGEIVRQTVKKSFEELLEKLMTSGLTALGWSVVQDAIARAMPQTYAETLYYGCGFAPEVGHVDLRPGMVLRVEYESYQYVGPAVQQGAVINGYLTSGVGEYDIGSYVDSSARWLTGVDAFLSAVTDLGCEVPAPQVKGNAVAGAGGAIDLYYSQFRQPFCRLVYPQRLARAESPGRAEPDGNVALLAAGDYKTLKEATIALRREEPLGNGVFATYLRGRTTVTACIRVLLDEAPRVVPVGTTVGNLLEGAARRPPAVEGLALSGISLIRAQGSAITGPDAATAPYDVGAGVPVRLDWGTDSVWGGNRDWLSLPLLSGDALWTGAL
ncbi:MAG TPA: hypothetical protein VK721_06400 [Solirubrobacteraceae bacterium]|nr:hypothetical protein [Solirubrobacteraceae bacterium]